MAGGEEQEMALLRGNNPLGMSHANYHTHEPLNGHGSRARRILRVFGIIAGPEDANPGGLLSWRLKEGPELPMKNQPEPRKKS